MLVTGIGRQNTERTLSAQLARATPSFVLTCGFAGALDPALPLNALLCATTDNALAMRLQNSGARPTQFHCATRMAITAAEKAALRRDTGADAVEMESAHVHRLCNDRGVPCATLRVISDTASEDMPLDFNALTTPGMEMHFGKLALAIAKSPGTIPGLLRLQRQTAAAAVVLAEAISKLVNQ
jgi:adenosylhomocysteine nucleosidase